MKWLVLAALVLSMQVTSGRSARTEETIYPSHPCDTGWYTVSSGTDYIIVACYEPDPDN